MKIRKIERERKNERKKERKKKERVKERKKERKSKRKKKEIQSENIFLVIGMAVLFLICHCKQLFSCMRISASPIHMHVHV